MTKRRNGYSDFAIPLALLRKDLNRLVRENKTASHEDLVRIGVEKVLRPALFAQYENEFLGYIVTNALNMAVRDEEIATGRNQTTNTPLAAPKDADEAKTSRVPPEVLQARLARREERAAQFVAAVEKRYAMRIAFDCTMHELWTLGGAARRLGKKNDRRIVTSVHSTAKLNQAGIGVEGGA